MRGSSMILKAGLVDGVYKLWCDSYTDKPQMFLWSVYVSTGHKGTDRHFVISDTEQHAIDMARCAMRCASYEITDEQDRMVECHAVKVPLSIQGWGASKF